MSLLAYLESQKFHPSASHVPPDYRDGFNHALQTVIDRIQTEQELSASGMQGMEAPSDQPHELIDALLNVALYGDRGNERGMRWQIGELLNSRAAIAAATSPNEGGKG